ncbi:MAG: ABC transporter ATP-binding protein/permease [Rhizobiales bacterium]|nr:ABC transporter ATP-binding protein/permease [Hyphomicrobiales bacterium]
MTSLVSTLATIWRLAAPYFRSEDRVAGCLLLALVIAIELSLVGIDVLFNQWNNRFFNALQDRNWDSFVTEIVFFCTLAALYIVLAVYQLYLNQWLQIRWRRWMTQRYLGHWLDEGNHYRMQLLGDAADNPDQRIADDIRLFVERTLEIGVGLLSAVVTLASFVVILWILSAAAPLYLFGYEVSVPGYLVWAALIYAVAGTLLTHLIGWPLAKLNFYQQRYEADFRFNLVRVRENSEQIALLRGDAPERNQLLGRFANVVNNWYAIMTRQKRLTFFTAGYRQASIIFPYIVVSPAYFAGKMQLGGLTQTASAFNSVQSALSFFITVYPKLAEWHAVIERLAGFDLSIETAHRVARTPPVVEVTAFGHASRSVAIEKLTLNLPTGAALLTANGIEFGANERVLVTGPSGSGKSTLLRAIAGAWPFGAGQIEIPKGAKILVLPQRPYFPIATLAAAITYPAEPGTFAGHTLAEMLVAVGLPQLVEHLDEEAHWNRMLSLGEQQRLGIARAILEKPDFLFLDEATASLDEKAEAELYGLLHERLARTTIVSIGHRSTLTAFHERNLVIARERGINKIREKALQGSAQ